MLPHFAQTNRNVVGFLCMLILRFLQQYASLMILILLAEIAIGCVMYAMKDQTEAETKKLLSTSLEKYYDKYPSMDIVTLTWDETMVSVSTAPMTSYFRYVGRS